MRKLLLFLLVSLSTYSFSQDIAWGELVRQSGSIYKTIPTETDQFLVIRYFSGNFSSSFSVERYQGLEKVQTKKLRTTANKRIATFRGIDWINDQLVMFVSNRSEGRENLYAKLYDDQFDLIEDKLIGFFDLDKKRKEGVFHYKISQNNKYLGVFWDLEGKNNQNHVYGFRIFGPDWQLHHEGEYEVPIAPEFSKIHSSHLSNSGDFFLCISELEKVKKSISKYAFKSLHLYHIAEGDGLQDYVIEFPQKEINAVGLSSEDTSLFTMTGVYSDTLASGLSGMFLVKFDLNQREIVSQVAEPFDTSFIKSSWEEKQRDLFERRAKKRNYKPSLMNYEMREIVFMKDGSIFCSLEQYYIDKRHEFSGPTGGGDYPVNYFHYNDVVGYKIGIDNKIEWIKKIDKRQTSIDDNGLYSGFFSVVSDSSYRIYFNDNVVNYHESGAWNESDNVAPYSTSKNSNAFAQVEVNMYSGEINRKAITSRLKTSVVLIPQDFQRSFNDILLIGVLRGKERFGKLKID